MTHYIECASCYNQLSATDGTVDLATLSCTNCDAGRDDADGLRVSYRDEDYNITRTARGEGTALFVVIGSDGGHECPDSAEGLDTLFTYIREQADEAASEQEETDFRDCFAVPAIARAVIAQTGGWDEFVTLAHDVADHGADAGFSGFTYYSDTVPFAQANKADIRKLAEYVADSIGEYDGFYSFVASFNCLDLTTDEVADAMHDSDHDSNGEVLNALAWFALEEVSRAYADTHNRD